jgi:dTDP-4-dehydrorhamnose 3,5-epimerase
VAAEDQQPKEATPVEETLKDTLEFVESRKVESGGKAAAVKGADIPAPKVTANTSKATKKGVLRGLHFQKNFPQDKLVRVISGEVYDVAVDLREGSKTFGQHYGILLSAENKKQFMIPKGFAHGFLVVSDYAEFCYKVTDFYHPNDEGGLAFDDPDINVQWPIPEGMTKEDLILSDKDKVNASFKEYCKEKGIN